MMPYFATYKSTILGHTSLDTVMIYTAPRRADLAERMEKMDLPSDYLIEVTCDFAMPSVGE